jgi:hypothetical protein
MLWLIPFQLLSKVAWILLPSVLELLGTMDHSTFAKLAEGACASAVRDEVPAVTSATAASITANGTDQSRRNI